MLHVREMQWCQDIGGDIALLQRVLNPLYKIENLTACLSARPVLTIMSCSQCQSLAPSRALGSTSNAGDVTSQNV